MFATEEGLQHASNIIVCSFGDHASSVVWSTVEMSVETLEKLEDRYDLISTSMKLSSISELVSVKSSAIWADILKLRERVACIIDIHRAMKTQLDESSKSKSRKHLFRLESC